MQAIKVVPQAIEIGPWQVADFLSKLDQFPGIQADEDHLWGQGNSKGIFEVNATYKIMNQSNDQIEN